MSQGGGGIALSGPMPCTGSTPEVNRIGCCKEDFFFMTSVYLNIALYRHIIYEIASKKRALSEYTIFSCVFLHRKK